MNKKIALSILVSILYVIFVIIVSLFLVTFGEKSFFEKILIAFLNFPIPLNTKNIEPAYIGPILLNGLIWGVVTFLVLKLKNQVGNKNDEDNLLDSNKNS